MEDDIKKFIEEEEKAILHSEDANDIVNKLYNLIFVKNEKQHSIYTDIKTFIKHYAKLVETNKYGYDALCYDKVFSIVDLLPYNERISLLNFLIYTITREYPEFEIETIQSKIKKVKIEKVCNEKKLYKKILQTPNAVLIWSSLRVSTLLATLLLFVMVVYIVLLPAPTLFRPLFEITYVSYSDNFYFNHLLYVLSLFTSVDGSGVKALNPLGLIGLMIGRIIFILLVVNFIYKKITDKISIK